MPNGEETQLEDVSLDLSAYYQAFEDIKLFLQGHDGIEYRDLQSALAAADWTAEDLAMFLSAWLQGLDDAALDLSAHYLCYEDMKSVLTAYGQKMPSFPALLEAAGAGLQSLKSFLHATAGVVFGDLGCFFTATDGIVRSDLGLWLCAFSGIPAFRSVTAQRVSSVVHEVT